MGGFRVLDSISKPCKSAKTEISQKSENAPQAQGRFSSTLTSRSFFWASLNFLPAQRSIQKDIQVFYPTLTVVFNRRVCRAKLVGDTWLTKMQERDAPHSIGERIWTQTWNCLPPRTLNHFIVQFPKHITSNIRVVMALLHSIWIRLEYGCCLSF